MKKPLQRLISILAKGRFATSAVLVAAMLAVSSAQAQTYTKTTLHEFTGGTDGALPNTRLIMDKAGNLYGVTQTGGKFYNGTIFKVDVSGNETVLHTFTEAPYGAGPSGRLTMDAVGNLYGTTIGGGAYGFGTIFEFSKGGTYTVLYNFNGGQYGSTPEGGLLYVEGEGSFFGTTFLGGNLKVCSSGCGIVYKLAKNSSGWTLTVLHAFNGRPDGTSPYGELTRDAQGYLYGTTQTGGASNVGTIFKVRGRQEAVVYSFAGGSDGQFPSSGLLLDSAGNLYGTTPSGGGGRKCVGGYSNGCGTVYKVDASGHETVLYAFTGGADGAFPNDRLVTDAAGNLYGTTQQGGEKPYSGTAYEVDSTGTETVLYNFLGGKDGRFPDGLAIDAAGNLYGVTELGGLKSCLFESSCGTVFKLTPH